MEKSKCYLPLTDNWSLKEMYYEDLTTYEYGAKEDSLNIGWLDKDHGVSQKTGW